MSGAKQRLFKAFFIVVSIALSVVLARSAASAQRPRAAKRTGKAIVGTNSATGTPYTRVIGDEFGFVDWRALVNQRVTIRGPLVIVDTFDLIRRGQVTVARDRLFVPTNRVDPNDAQPSGIAFVGGGNVEKVTQAERNNRRATLIIDDGSVQQNIFPPALFPDLGTTQPTIRIGSVIDGVSGKIVQAGNSILLVPSRPLEWTPAKRPARPNIGQADTTVASFNVLNYFTTLDNRQNNARGADSKSELKRQEAKLVSAIVALEADIIGLIEIENNRVSEGQIVAALNRRIGRDVFEGCGIPDGLRISQRGDGIGVRIIYRSDRVEPVGDVSMVSGSAFAWSRQPIVQTFKTNSAGKSLTVIVNHFKSKSGADRADAANQNKGDGQGAFNATRRKQSLAVCDYVDQMKRNDPAARVLVIGDLNAYSQEDPIDAMRARGLVDLVATEKSPNEEVGHYSYVFRGQSGCLDHALATETLAADVTGVAAWHINADEPRFLDYNEEWNPQSLYRADPYRSSDHDPILIGIRDR